MRLQTLAGTAALAVVLAATAAAADVTGKWVAQVPTRGGEMRETTFTFKADGEKLTGTMSGPRGETEISDGKVSGDELSFTVNLSFNGNDVKLLYKGTVSGSEIKFTREREGSDRKQEFTAKRLPT
ncbi:MAG TPA: hypothetical protein VEU62_09700 [Bryobacterales bacterium]|nr:hypothetical protein [Bryobacterales bacterium]